MGNIDLSGKSDREILILLVDHVNTANQLLGKQNGRINSLELWRAGILGGMGLMTVVFPALTAFALKLMG